MQLQFSLFVAASSIETEKHIINNNNSKAAHDKNRLPNNFECFGRAILRYSLGNQGLFL